MKNGERGVTLIEIMIAVSLLAFLLMISVPSLVSYFQNTKIRGVADSIQGALQQTKSEAIRRNSVVNFVFNNTGWSIIVPGQNGVADTLLSKRAAQANEANILLTASANTIGFNGQNQTYPLNSYTVQLTSPSNGTCKSAGGTIRCLTVRVSTTGSIKLCDPALASTDPRAC